MSVVKAEDDEGFVAEVADTVQSSCTQMNEHISAMIEEYMRRRVQHAQAETQRVCDAQLLELTQKLAAREGEKAAAEGRCASMTTRLAKAADALERSARARHTQGYFSHWRVVAVRRRERRRLAEEVERRTRQLRMLSAFSDWRCLAATRRGAHHEAAALRERDCREQGLRDAIATVELQLLEEKEKNAVLDERLKEAFVRGMCALNREAVQVLHGPDGNQEDVVEAIADILSRDTQSRRQSAAPGRSEGVVPASNTPSSICPVHQVDSSGHFYHRCYAPGYCHYGAQRSPSQTPSLPSSSPAQSTPFVVRADPQAARSFNASASVNSRPGPRPAQARWKM